MKILNWRTNKDINFNKKSIGEYTVLPAYSYVTPVRWEYLPVHIQQEFSLWEHVLNDKIKGRKADHVMCYTQFGYIPIAIDDLDEELPYYAP